MAKCVHSHALVDAKRGRCAVNRAPDGIGTQWLAGILPRKNQRPSRLGEAPIVTQGFEQPPRQRHQPWPVAFAVTDVDEPSLAINVAGFERQHLGDAQTGPVGSHDDHAADERLDFPE
jgi:hypothetical protein